MSAAWIGWMARRAPGRTAAAIPDLRRLEHGRASCRQLRPIGRLRGIGRRQRHRGTREPEIERLAAAFVGIVAGLRLALRVAGRAVEPDVEMLVVTDPHDELVEPGAIAGDRLAEPLLDPLVDEHTVEMGHLRRQPKQADMLLGEYAVVDAAVIRQDERAQPRGLALGRRQPRAVLALEPDVGVQAGLVTGMTGDGRTAARLADIADIKRRLARGAHFFRQRLDEVE